MDDAVNILQNEVIELEEELEAIAPSLARGTYYYDKAVVLPNENPAIAHFYLIDDQNRVTDQYLDAAKVVLHNTNIEGFTQTWATVKVGQLIQLYDKPDEDVLLGEITDIDTTSYVDGVAFEIDNVGASGSPGNLPDSEGYLIARLNIFDAPLGGDASMFVLKTGDKMEGPGPLEFLSTETVTRYDSPATGQPYIKFKNTYNGINRTANLFHSGNNDYLILGGAPFMVRNSISSSGYYYAYDGTRTVNPRMLLNETNGGKLQWGSNERINWDSSGLRVNYGTSTRIDVMSSRTDYKGTKRLEDATYISNSSNNRLYANTSATNSTNTYGSPGEVLTSNGNNGPAYWGNATGSHYVKTNDTGWDNNLTITKSGGNYYITGG